MSEKEHQTSTEYREARETIRYEYQDEQGNIIGASIVELGSEVEDLLFEEILDSKTGVGKVVKSWLFEGKKDGETVRINVLDLVQAHDIKILMATNRIKCYHHNHDDKKVEIPPLETLTDVAIALHELGHYEQSKQKIFKKLNTYIYLSKEKKAELIANKFYQLREIIDGILAILPEANSPVLSDLRERLTGMEIHEKEVLGEYDSISTKISHLEAIHKQTIQSIVEQYWEEVVPSEPFPFYDDADTTDPKKFQESLRLLGISFENNLPDSSDFPQADDMSAQHVPPAEHDISLDTIDPTELKKAWHSFKIQNADITWDGYKLKIIFPWSRWRPELKVCMEIGLPGALAEKYTAEQSSYKSKMGELRNAASAKQKILDENKASIARIIQQDLKNFFELPSQILEWDATLRDFRWMRQIGEEAGTNLFVKTRTPNIARIKKSLEMKHTHKERVAAGMSCAEAAGAALAEMRTEAVTAQKELAEAFDSYGVLSRTRILRQLRRSLLNRVKENASAEQ